ERVGAWVEELDREQAIVDRSTLTHQLIHPLLHEHARTAVRDVTALSVCWRLAVDRNAERDGRTTLGRPHHEVDVARVERELDAATPLVQMHPVGVHRPVPGKGPL